MQVQRRRDQDHCISSVQQIYQQLLIKSNPVNIAQNVNKVSKLTGKGFASFPYNAKVQRRHGTAERTGSGMHRRNAGWVFGFLTERLPLFTLSLPSLANEAQARNMKTVCVLEAITTSLLGLPLNMIGQRSSTGHLWVLRPVRSHLSPLQQSSQDSSFLVNITTTSLRQSRG